MHRVVGVGVVIEVKLIEKLLPSGDPSFPALSTAETLILHVLVPAV